MYFIKYFIVPKYSCVKFNNLKIKSIIKIYKKIILINQHILKYDVIGE